MEKTIFTEANKELIGWLRSCREQKGLTMRDVAKKLDVSHSWIEKVELGDRRLDLVEYIRYCQILEVDPHEGLDMIADKV